MTNLKMRALTFLPGGVFGGIHTVLPVSGDATTTLQQALDEFGLIALTTGETYEIRRSLLLPSEGGIIGNSATIHMPAAYFNNADPSAGTRYGTNSVGLKAWVDSNLSAPAADITISDLHIVGDSVDGNYNIPILSRNCIRLRINNIEISGFAVGRGICLSNQTDATVSRISVHNWYTNISWGSAASQQATGIEIDNDQLSATPSRGIKLDDIDIFDLTQGATAVAAWGDQTDGINEVNHPLGVMKSNVRIRNVGDGFDSSGGTDGSLTNFHLEDCRGFGIKLPHGASGNMISNGVIRNAGIWGLTMGTAAGTGSTRNNQVSNVLIDGIDPTGVWGATYEVACIAMTEVTDILQANIFDNVTCYPKGRDGLSFGKWAMLIRPTTGAINRYRLSMPQAGTSGWINTSGPTPFVGHRIKVIDCTDVYASMNSAQTITSAGATINFDIDTSADDRSEFNTTTHSWTCQIAGRYYHFIQVAGVQVATEESQIKLILNGGATPLAIARFKPDSADTMALTIVYEGSFLEGDVVRVDGIITGGASNWVLATAGNLTHWNIRMSGC